MRRRGLVPRWSLCIDLETLLSMRALLFAWLFGAIFADQTTENDQNTASVLMPGVIPQAESYVCTSVPIDNDIEHYITGFKAEVESHNAHHILVFGCEEPGSDQIVWDCGEMNKQADGMERAPTCASKPNIIYAWARDAPELKLPKDVGFKVGGASRINHIVVQVHYMHDAPEEDESGVTFTFTDEPQPKQAATMLLVTGGVMAPNTKETFETACVIEEDVEMHPFAFRTHTHRHGTEVDGWVVQENEKGADSWSLVGRRDPQLPQMFVPVTNTSLVIHRGDMLAARCHMTNNEDRVISMGASGEDEMCNFYIMYWVDGDQVMRDNMCSSPGAPYYYWSSEAGLNNIPH